MKSKLIICGVLIIAILLTACSGTDVQPSTEAQPSDDIQESEALEIGGVEITGISTRYERNCKLPYSSLEQLLDPDWGVELIVIGEFIEDAETEIMYMYDDYFEKDIMYYGAASNKLQIKEMLKGDKKVGEIITVGQSYAIDEETGELFSFCESTPMHKGDRWIYFLGHFSNAEEYYKAINHKMGMEIAKSERIFTSWRIILLMKTQCICIFRGSFAGQLIRYLYQ